MLYISTFILLIYNNKNYTSITMNKLKHYFAVIFTDSIFLRNDVCNTEINR